MTLNLSTDGEGGEIIDTSQLTDYQDCPRWYSYRYHLGLKFPPLFAEAPFSTWLVHRPITEWYRLGGDYVPDWPDLWGRFLEEFPNPPKWASMEFAAKIYDRYLEQFSGDLRDYEVLAVERVVETHILGFVVKPDVVWRRRSDGLIVPMDLKMSKKPKQYTGFVRQFCAQADAWESDRVVVNFFQRDDTGKLKDWVRDEIRITQDMLSEWREETHFSVNQMISSAKSDIWPKHDDHCFKGEPWECPALSLCESGRLRPNLISGMAKTDPLKYLKE